MGERKDKFQTRENKELVEFEDDEPIPVECPECNHHWQYTGKYNLDDFDARVGCSQCGKMTRLHQAYAIREETETTDSQIEEGEYTITSILLTTIDSLDRAKAREKYDSLSLTDDDIEHHWWPLEEIVDRANMSKSVNKDSELVKLGLEQIHRYDLAMSKTLEGERYYKLYVDWQNRRKDISDRHYPKTERILELEEELKSLSERLKEPESQTTQDIDTSLFSEEEKTKLIGYAVKEDELSLAKKVLREL